MPSKLEQLQLQFRQKLMQEKEERMIKIHTDSQQKALSKVTKYDSPPSMKVAPPMSSTISKKPSSLNTSPIHHPPTKKGSPGVDRSRPLPPITREAPVRHQSTAPRSHHSSTSSESSLRVSLHNGVRDKAMDSEVGNGTPKMRSAQPSESHRSWQQGRRSPDAEASWNQKQPPRSQASVRPNYDAAAKVSNGHGGTSLGKSSAEQRTMAGSGTRAPHPSTAVIRGRASKATVITTMTKRVDVKSKPKPANGYASTFRKPPNPNQEQCRHCGRNFNKDRIEKHVSICSKTSQKKPKVFDVTKMRVKGTEAESYVKKGAAAASNPPKAKKSNWKKQHEDFINAIRQAKMAQRHLAAGGKLSDLPPPPPSDTSDYVPCPYCGRKFNEGVAQRHIPKCKNILSNKKPPLRKK